MSDQVDFKSLISVKEFVTLAPEVNPQNQLRNQAVSEGGARRSQFDQLMGGLNLIRVVNSPSIPVNIKLKIMRSAGALGLIRADRQESIDDAAQLYSSGNEYLTTLQFYMLRDILTYILAHEVSHIVLGHLSATSEVGTVSQEIAADKLALSALFKLTNTDVRALILAMSSFGKIVQDRGQLDGDHPFSSDRLRILFRRLVRLSRT